MKKIFIAFAAILFAGFAFAQTPVNPFPKTITVNGSAEMEIIPDEIYVQVDLKEYDKKGLIISFHQRVGIGSMN